jgi:hypothetical protein
VPNQQLYNITIRSDQTPPIRSATAPGHELPRPDGARTSPPALTHTNQTGNSHGSARVKRGGRLTWVRMKAMGVGGVDGRPVARALASITRSRGAQARGRRDATTREVGYSPRCVNFFFRLRGWAAGLRCGVVGKFSEEVRVHIRGLAVAARRLVRGCVTWVGLAAVGSDGCDGLKLFFSSFFLEEQREEKSR